MLGTCSWWGSRWAVAAVLRRIVAAGRCGMAAQHDACCCVADDDLSRATLEPGETTAPAASVVAGAAFGACAGCPARLLCAH